MTPRGWRYVLILFFSAVLALFLVSPLMCPYGAVTGISGRPVDPEFFDLWRTLPPVPDVMYSAGDILCHQQTERSFVLNGNQLPVCARDISALAGLVIGFLICVPDRRAASSSRICVPFLAISFALMAADVVIQNVLGLNVFATRVITGAMCGISVSLAADRWLRSF